MPGRYTDCLVVPALRLYRGEGLAEALRCLREFDPRIFLVYGGDAEDVQWLRETLEDQAGHPILFCAELERGAGQQFGGLTPMPDAWALGILGEEAAFESGHRTAAEAAQAGVRWILGPVLDLHRMIPADAVRSPAIANRSFGGDPDEVAGLARAWLAGLAQAGGTGCGKHFPGQGASPQDAHVESAVAFEDPGEHLRPFRELLGDLPSVMVGHVQYPLVDEDSLPASRSRRVLGLLREEWGYEGVVVTDSLRMAGFGDGPHEQQAIESLHAGVDLLLDPEDPVVLALSLSDSAARGDLDEARIREASRRVEAFVEAALARPVEKPRPLVLGAGARKLLRPLHGGSPGRRHPPPGVVLALSPSRDALVFLEEQWGLDILGPSDPIPDPLPEAILILWGAALGHGLPPLPTPWVEACAREHPILYIAGAPEAQDMSPAHCRGFHLPGVSPALLALLFGLEED